jgi:hypothetical protein
MASIFALDAGSGAGKSPEAKPSLALRISGNLLASAGFWYALLFVVSLAYVPPLWNSAIKARHQGKTEFMIELAREYQETVFSRTLVGAFKEGPGDYSSARHELGAGIANAIATVLRPFGYVALATSPYNPTFEPEFKKLDENTQKKLSARYPEAWLPTVTFPGLLLVVGLTVLVIDAGLSVSLGSERAPRELLTLMSISLVTALVVAGYGPIWVTVVLVLISGGLAVLAMASRSWRVPVSET